MCKEIQNSNNAYVSQTNDNVVQHGGHSGMGSQLRGYYIL